MTVGTLSFYRERLRVNRHRLDQELEEHAQRLEEIGRRCAGLNREVEATRSDRDVKLAQLVRRVKSTDPKATAPVIDAEAALDPVVSQANSGLRDKQLEHAEWEALNRAWYQRGFDLKALGELYGAQYFAINSVSGNGGERVPDASLRQAMREASTVAGSSVPAFTRIGKLVEAELHGVRRRWS
jgi:hypothetical protein